MKKNFFLIIFLLLFGFNIKVYATSNEPQLIIPSYETNDTIVADYVISPANNPKTDMTDTIQNTLNECFSNKGGTVFLEKGIYYVSKPITIPKLCTLRGDWQDPDSTNDPEYGTIIIVDVNNFNYQIVNSDIEKVGLFKIEDSAGAVGLTIYYQNQSITSPIPQPWTFIYSEDGDTINQIDLDNRNLLKTIKNITMINSYLGIGNSINYNRPLINNSTTMMEFIRPHEMLMIENVKGTTIKSGVAIHNSSDVGTITGLTLKPDYWANANLSAFNVSDSKPSLSSIQTYMKQNAIGLTITDAEQQQYANLEISGYKYGIYIPDGDILSNGNNKSKIRIAGSGSIYNLNIKDCKVGIHIDEGFHYGWFLPGSECQNSNAKLTTIDLSSGYLISNSNISGDTFAIEHLSSEISPNDVITSQCYSAISYYEPLRGRLKLNDVAINGKVSDGRDTLNRTIPGIVYYSETNETYIPLNNGTYNDDVSVNRSRKFLNIKLDRKTKTTGEDFIAVTNNLTASELNIKLDNAAKNGGGVVYLKPGLYEFDETLIVPENVELRGVSSVSVRTAGKSPIDLSTYTNENDWVQGTVIKVGDYNSNVPVIRITGNNAGVTGITFINQDNINILSDENPNIYTQYKVNNPRIILSENTKGIFIKNLGIIGSAYGIYLDNCTYFNISNIVTGLLGNVIYIKNSTDGIIMNNLQNLSLIERNDLYYIAEGKMATTGFPQVKRNLKYIVIEDSSRINLQNNFVYGGFVYLEAKNSNIYAVNNGSDGFDYADDNDNIIGYPFSLVGNNNSVVYVNNLTASHNFYINVNGNGGNVGIYNQDRFFKWLEGGDNSIVPDRLNITMSSVTTANYKTYNPTLITAETEVEYNSDIKLLNIKNKQGKVYYALDTPLDNTNYNTTGSTTIPKATNISVGDHICYYYMPETTETYARSGSVNVSIVPATTPTVISIPESPSDKIYNGQIQTSEIITPDGTHIVSASSTIEAINAGTYTIVYELDNQATQIWSDNTTSNKEITWKINKKDVSVVWQTTEWTYDGNEHHTIASVNNTIPNETIYVDITNNSIKYKGTKVVTATCEEVTGGSENCNNYNLINNTNNISIIAKNLTITALDQTLDYIEELSDDPSKVSASELVTNDNITAITLTSSNDNKIIPSNAIIKNGNTDVTSSYNITYVAGNLTINHLKGDMNKDGKIGLQDVIDLLKKYLEIEEITPEDIQIGDMNNDGNISLQDIILLLKIYLGIN